MCTQTAQRALENSPKIGFFWDFSSAACAIWVHILGAPFSPQKLLPKGKNIFQSQHLTPTTQKVPYITWRGEKNRRFSRQKHHEKVDFPENPLFSWIRCCHGTKITAMGPKYVFNTYFALSERMVRPPVCAPKRHNDRTKIDEFRNFGRNFEISTVPPGCTYWRRITNPEKS